MIKVRESKREVHHYYIFFQEGGNEGELTEREQKIVDILDKMSNEEYNKFYTPIRKWLGYEHGDENVLWGDERKHVFQLIEPILLKEKREVV